MSALDAAELEYHAACIEYVEKVLCGHVPLGLTDTLAPAAKARQKLLRLEKEKEQTRDDHQ